MARPIPLAPASRHLPRHVTKREPRRCHREPFPHAENSRSPQRVLHVHSVPGGTERCAAVQTVPPLRELGRVLLRGPRGKPRLRQDRRLPLRYRDRGPFPCDIYQLHRVSVQPAQLHHRRNAVHQKQCLHNDSGRDGCLHSLQPPALDKPHDMERGQQLQKLFRSDVR